MNDLINLAISGFINLFNDILMPLMVLGFLGGVTLRFLINYTIKREEWFVKAFQKRVYDYLDKVPADKRHNSFYITAKVLLEKTFYELFIMRAVLKRRNDDVILDKADRVFLIQPGCAKLVKDTLRHIRFFRYDIHRPNTLSIASNILEKNPHFSRVFGYLSVGTFTDILNALPGLFIVGGIFGTFLGIMKALPELGGMDLADIEKTKAVMDFFLVKMSYSMITSILGIVLNVMMTLVNSFLNPEKVFVNIVERYDDCLDTLWNSCSDNKVPSDIPNFDENRDPLEALAEDAVHKELVKNRDHLEDIEGSIEPSKPQPEEQKAA